MSLGLSYPYPFTRPLVLTRPRLKAGVVHYQVFLQEAYYHIRSRNGPEISAGPLHGVSGRGWRGLLLAGPRPGFSLKAG